MKEIMSFFWVRELSKIEADHECEELKMETIKNEAKLLKLLNTEQREAMERFNISDRAFSKRREELIFTRGVNLGIKIFLNALCDK